MSLRKPTSVTPQRRDAQRRNAQQSTGPRSEAGKERMKMNALKHGCDDAPENEAAVMRALGEDPEQFAALKRDLAAAFAPGDALSSQLVDDLARLYWRRNRVQRLETGLMREALEGVEERRRALARALADVTFEPSQYDAVAFDLPKPTHPCVRRRMLLSFWGVMREQVRQWDFNDEQASRVESYYEGELGWRLGQIGYLLGLFAGRASRQRHEPDKVAEYVKEYFGGEAGLQACYQELVRLVEEQRAAEEAGFAAEMQAQERKDAIARDSCLAPEDARAIMVLRLEMTLDRAIDRKVKMLLALRKEQARVEREAASREVGAPLVGAPRRRAQGPPGREETTDRAAEELSKVVGLDAAEVAPNFSSADAGLKASATETGSPAGENGAETPKSPEQSQNVIENKGPAVVQLGRTDASVVRGFSAS